MTVGRRRISTLLTEQPPREGALSFGSKGPRDWQHFTNDVETLAARIRNCGGDRWLIASDDAYEVVLGLLAALHAGAVAMLPANLRPGHLAQISARAAGLLANEPPPGCDIPVVSLSDIAADGERLALSPLDPDHAMIDLHTSGSTGDPVTVTKPLRCFENEIAVLDAQFALEKAVKVIGTVPPFHAFSLIFGALWPLTSSRQIASDITHFPGELERTLDTKQDTILVSSPAFLKRVLPVLDLARLDRHLCGIFSAGGPLAPEIAATYNQKLTHKLVEIYGSTETGAVGHRTVLDARTPPALTPLPGIRTSTDQATGALMITSPFLPNQDWHRMGDGAELLPGGRFVLRGRIDRVVKIEERRISLVELERRLSEHPDVAAAQVVQLASKSGRRVVLGAVVVPTGPGWKRLRSDGKALFRAGLQRSLATHLDSAALPRRWRFVRHRPETSLGKVSNAALVALFDSPADGGHPHVQRQQDHAGGVRLTLDLRPDLECFDGHFEGTPILAGVVQVDWAVRFAGQHFKLPDGVEAIEKLKFFKIITPDQAVDLDLRYDDIERRLQFSYTVNEQVRSAGRVRFRART